MSLGKNGAHELIERRQLFLVHELELSAGRTRCQGNQFKRLAGGERTSSRKSTKWWNEVLRWAVRLPPRMRVSRSAAQIVCAGAAAAGHTFDTESTQLCKVVVVQVGIDPEEAAVDRLYCGEKVLRKRSACDPLCTKGRPASDSSAPHRSMLETDVPI